MKGNQTELKGKIHPMPKQRLPKRIPTPNDPLNSYENRLSRDGVAFLRDLAEGKLDKVPVGQLHMGTYGSMLDRKRLDGTPAPFCELSDVLDENGEPRPRITTLGLQALQAYTERPAPLRNEPGKITDRVIQLLLGTRTARQGKRRAS